MAQTKVTKPGIADDAVETSTIKNLNVTNAKIAAGTIDVTAKITGIVPPANLGTGTASATTYLAGDGSYKALSEYDDNQVQSNIAMLGFKVAINGSLARYNLVDQSIDEYEDTSGIDASASTNERRGGSAGAYYYDGAATTTPTVTEDADDKGTDGDYSWYKWTDTGATGSYDNDTTQDHEYLIVGGGGSGGEDNAGGGAGGGVLAATGLSLTGGNEYTVTIGAGGASVGASSVGNDGGDSILSGTGITTLTAGGGGYGGINASAGGAGSATNGNGGGGGYQAAGGAGDGAGFDGGTQSTGSPAYGGGGGAGAAENGEAGTASNGGDGGDGVANDIIETGTNVYYAGGGGASAANTQGACGAAGNGGGGAGDRSGGAGAAINGTANTGGGGGGSTGSTNVTGAGGSGIVILRRLTTVIAAGADLTLQSTDVTATAEPDYGEFVTLIENAYGTAVLDTDIKGYVSRDSGTTWTQGNLVDEGSWGTNKKVLGFHDLDISAQPSGTSMCYKITTHNQSTSSKETRIYATSIGWR